MARESEGISRAKSSNWNSARKGCCHSRKALNSHLQSGTSSTRHDLQKKWLWAKFAVNVERYGIAIIYIPSHLRREEERELYSSLLQEAMDLSFSANVLILGDWPRQPEYILSQFSKQIPDRFSMAAVS